MAEDKDTKPAPRIPNRPSSGSTITAEWGQAVHDDVVARHILSGDFTLTFSNENRHSQWQNYLPGGGYAFAGSIFVVMSLGDEQPNSYRVNLLSRVWLDDIFEVAAFTTDGQPISDTVRVHWIAIGNRR